MMSLVNNTDTIFINRSNQTPQSLVTSTGKDTIIILIPPFFLLYIGKKVKKRKIINDEVAVLFSSDEPDDVEKPIKCIDNLRNGKSYPGKAAIRNAERESDASYRKSKYKFLYHLFYENISASIKQ